MIELEQSPAAEAGIDALAAKLRHHRKFATARLMLVMMFIGLWVVIIPVGPVMPLGFLLVLIAEAGVLLYYRWLLGKARTVRALDRLHYCLLVCELGFHTAIVYFLGGLSWLGPMAYIYALMYATIFLTWRQAVLFTAAVVAAFTVLVSLDGAGVIPHQWYLPQDADRYQDPRFIATTVIAFVGVLFTVTFWMVFVGNEVRRERDEALKANAQLVGVQEQLRALAEELEHKVEERTEALLRRAETDQLTGLLNRGAIARRLREHLALAHRGARPLAVILADGDKFKSCNDRGGHPYGDRILQFLARGLSEKLRESDYVGRMGGDEFLMVLPDTDAAGAIRLCRRVTRYIEKKQERSWEGLPVPTLSFGIAIYPDCARSSDELVRTADEAMYKAKREGGNCWRLGPGAAETEEVVAGVSRAGVFAKDGTAVAQQPESGRDDFTDDAAPAHRPLAEQAPSDL